MTSVTPIEKLLPDAIDECSTTPSAPRLSEIAGVAQLTTAVGRPGSHGIVTLAGQPCTKTGFSVSKQDRSSQSLKLERMRTDHANLEEAAGVAGRVVTRCVLHQSHSERECAAHSNRSNASAQQTGTLGSNLPGTMLGVTVICETGTPDSKTVGALHVTTAVETPCDVGEVMFAGQP